MTYPGWGRVGTGGTFGTDAVARANAQAALDAVNPPASTSLDAGDTVIVERQMFTANKATTMPAGATAAVLAANDDFDAGGAASGVVKWEGPFTTNQTIVSNDFTSDVSKKFFDTSGGALEAVIDAGLPEGSEFYWDKTGGNPITFRSTAPETIMDVTGAEGAEVDGDGSGLFKLIGSNWRLIRPAPANPGAAQSKVIAHDGYYHSQASGNWWNNSGGTLTVGDDESEAAMEALGFTALKGNIA